MMEALQKHLDDSTTVWENLEQIEVVWPSPQIMNGMEIKLIACEALLQECGIEEDPDDICLDKAIEVVNYYGYLKTGSVWNDYSENDDLVIDHHERINTLVMVDSEYTA